jgi:uncharacterized repeat protein (TIGR01451 family)
MNHQFSFRQTTTTKLPVTKAFLLILLMVCMNHLYGQVITPFSIRYQATQKGGIRYISNTTVTCNNGCAERNQVPPAGNGTDNGFTAAYADIDSDGSTFSSSSDSIALPTCSQISWAGLYWGGEITNAAANYATRNQVRIKVDNGSYVSLTADQFQDNGIGFDTYHCFKDITSIVRAAGTNARYTVANVAVRTGGSNRFGGWTIVVVYKNDLQPMRNLTVFNGLSNVSGSNPITDITVSGFLTPLSGPVTFEVGHVTHDGDRSSTGDQLMFNGGNGFVNISDAVNPLNDVFNSTYSYNGVQKTAPFINPGYTNSLGFDADIFIPNNAAKNYIGNSATSATLRLTTGGETFLTQVVTMAIDVYEPDIRAVVRGVDLNGGSVLPGDIIEYTIKGMNIGSDPSVNTFITDTLERNVVYVPGSLVVSYGPNAGPKSDAAGDDQGEYIAAQRVIRMRVGTGSNAVTGGQMNNSTQGVDSTQIRFRVMATTDCVVLACDAQIDNRAIINGTGNVSGNSWNNQSSPDAFDGFGCPIAGTTTHTIITSSCTPPAATSNNICAGGAINLSATNSSSATYSWTGPNGFTSTSRTPTINPASLASAGTYTATITLTGMGCTYSPTTAVTVSVPSGLSGTVSQIPPDQQTHTFADASGYYTDGTCELIARVVSSGGNPPAAATSITSKVWIESTTPRHGPRPYVRRHYEITPATGSATATGTITLYFTQADFDAYNAVRGSLPRLPQNSADNTGIGNLRIGSYSGTSSNNSGLPRTFGAGRPNIDPPNAQIVWNATDARWEVTFAVTGFGGFIVHTSNDLTLPVSWLSFTAEKQNNNVLLKWQTSIESNSAQFVVEYSADGNNFTAIGTIAAAGNSNSVRNYSFVHTQPRNGNNFYRVRQVDIDGSTANSDIRRIDFNGKNKGFAIQVNPVVNGQLQVQFYENAKAIIYNANGQTIWTSHVMSGAQVIDLSTAAQGVYWLKAGDKVEKFVVR